MSQHLKVEWLNRYLHRSMTTCEIGFKVIFSTACRGLLTSVSFPNWYSQTSMKNSIAIRNTTLFCSFRFGGLSMAPWRDVAYILSLPAPSGSALALSSPWWGISTALQALAHPCSQHLILATLFFFLPWNRTVWTWAVPPRRVGPALTSGDEQATCKRITKAQSDRQGYPNVMLLSQRSTLFASLSLQLSMILQPRRSCH